MRWIVTQIGSREHYSVPRAFEKQGRLYRFYTDIWAGRCAPWMRKLPGAIGDFGNRVHPEIPADKVIAFNLLSIRQALGGVLSGSSKTIRKRYEMFSLIGRQFSEHVNRHLMRTRVQTENTAAFLFCTGALETCQLMRGLGVPVVVDQVDPGRTEQQIVRAEMEKWPGWQKVPGEIPKSYFDRLRQEWELANMVLVNSQWARSALVSEGIPARKVVAVPLCYEGGPAASNPPREFRTDRPVTVLWLGQVILRKGIQYLLEAAKQLQATNIRFVVVGPVGISDVGLAAVPSNVSIVGRVNRADTPRYYGEADVFVLPTVSDGFALTQLEAMSFGLPVITTPNCGDVVSDGVDGYIIPACQSQPLAEAILRLDRDRELLRQMSLQAVEKVKQRRFSLEGYVDAVESGLGSLMEPVEQ